MRICLLQGWLFHFLLTSSLFAFDHTHSLWTETLARYRTNEGRIAYTTFKADLYPGSRTAFEKYLKEVQAVTKKEFASWSKSQQLAFLINAYNALTVKLVLNHYPLKSIQDIGGLFRSPWKKDFFSLFEGAIQSLDSLEQDWLRARYQDVRIHAAVNCASVSCPKIASKAYTPELLDSQLNSAMTEWLNDPSRNHFDAKTETIEVSKVFDWYKKDFENQFGSLLKTFEKFGPPAAQRLAKRGAKVKFLPYDWKLNDGSPRPSPSPALARPPKK